MLNLAARLVRSLRISRAFYGMAPKYAPAGRSLVVRSGRAAGTGVANPGAARSIAVGGGVGNPFLRCIEPSMPAAGWNKDKRFTRIGESGEGAVGHGSFGEVFQGYDELRHEAVFIKRQRKDTDQAANTLG